MEPIEKQVQLLNFLNKNYHVKESIFLRVQDNQHEWGFYITDLLTIIFNFDKEFCENIFKNWAYLHGLTTETLKNAWTPQKLKTSWSPELAQDLVAYNNPDAERELINIISESLSKEIDAQILKDLKDDIKTGDELLRLVKCIGYKTGPTIFDANTFTPKNQFISMNQHEIEHERNNNIMWQNYVRARKRNT